MYVLVATRLTRLVTVLTALSLVLGGVLLGPAATAAADEREETLFRATFDGVTLGPVTAEVPTEVGTVAPQEGTVSVVRVTAGRALQLDGAAGQSTALLRWDNYPGSLPGSPPPAVKVDITGVFSTTTTDAGASFSLFREGNQAFELFTFGGGGQLTRAGSPIGLTYAAGERVRLEARVLLPGGSAGNVQIKLESGGSNRTLVVPLTAGFTAETLNQLRFQAPSGSGASTVRDVRVQFTQGGEEEDDDPPAIIVIRDTDVAQDLEVVAGVVFVNIRITIANDAEGGKARGVFLVLNLDELDDLDLAEVGFLEGAGYVREIRDGRVYIGLGQNNLIRGNGKVTVKIKMKVKPGRAQLRVTAHFNLQFRDTSGAREIPLAPVLIVVPGGLPASGVLPPGTLPITGTTPISRTAPISGTAIVRLPITAIDVRFRTTWERSGGVTVLGLPLSAPITRGDGLIVQYFERARLEYHPENAGTPYVVLLGRLAVELGYGEPPTATTAPTSTSELRWYSPATGHLIATPFRSYWQQRGGLLIFGLPIGPVKVENGLTVQYFERARLERHPELAGTPYEVQVGLLGAEAYLRDRADD